MVRTQLFPVARKSTWGNRHGSAPSVVAEAGKPAPVDYWARLNAYQPRAMTKAQSRALHDENRGER